MQLAARIFKECGAWQVVETLEDDVPDGKPISFLMAAQRKEDEAVMSS